VVVDDIECANVVHVVEKTIEEIVCEEHVVDSKPKESVEEGIAIEDCK
jgi:hypothetical protein